MTGPPSGGARSLFGGPLSTRSEACNYESLQRLQQQHAEAQAKEANKRGKKGGQAASQAKASQPLQLRPSSSTPNQPPALPSIKVKKAKLRAELDDFDDLGGDGPRPSKSKPSQSPTNGQPPPPTPVYRSRGVPLKSAPAPAQAPARPVFRDTTRNPSQVVVASAVHLPAGTTKPPAARMPNGTAALTAGVSQPRVEGPGRSGPGRPTPKEGTTVGRPGQGPAVRGQLPGNGPQRQRPGGSVAAVGMAGARAGDGPARQGPSQRADRPSSRADSADEYEADFVVDDEDEEDWRAEMRRITGYDPRRFRDTDARDDRAMVAGFRDIATEEMRSARLARAEDEREEQEENRRQQAKQAKKRKL